MVSDVLAVGDIESGALLAPFDQWLVVPNEYRMAFPLWLSKDSALQAFAEFIQAEAAAHQARLTALRRHARALPCATSEIDSAG